MYTWTDDQLAIRDAVRDFVDREIRPHQDELEQEIAGTHREHRVSRVIGFGHGITITTRTAESGMVLNRTASSSVC